MKAHIETSLDKGFLLGEEHLIKLSDIIQKRLTSDNVEGSILYKIFRVDGALFETESHDSVTSEENSTRNAIKRLEVSVQSDSLALKISFDPSESIELSVEASNKDIAYLMFSDVKDYLSSEVCSFRSFSFEKALSSRVVFPLFGMVIPLAALTMLMHNPSEEAYKAALATENIPEKINFLIERNSQQSSPAVLKIMIGVMFAGLILPFTLGMGLDKTFPRHVFYWGKAAGKYDRFVRIREKVIWGVIIAFVIGILSTVFVDYVKG